MPREAELSLRDIVLACERTQRYTSGLTRAEFFSEEHDVVYDAVLRNLMVIGEAVKNLPEEVRARMPSIPWKQVAAMRDILTHVYFGIDPDIVWDVIAHEIEPLREAVANYLSQRG